MGDHSRKRRKPHAGILLPVALAVVLAVIFVNVSADTQETAPPKPTKSESQTAASSTTSSSTTSSTSSTTSSSTSSTIASTVPEGEPASDANAADDVVTAPVTQSGEVGASAPPPQQSGGERPNCTEGNRCIDDPQHCEATPTGTRPDGASNCTAGGRDGGGE